MKSLMIKLLFLFPLICSAELNAAPNALTPFLESEKETPILISEQDGISVYATKYLLEDETYISLEFVNTSGKDLRFLWSLEMEGSVTTINMDGTTQAYLTIPSGQSIHFGKSNSSDPLLGTSSTDLKNDITISIEIQ